MAFSGLSYPSFLSGASAMSFRCSYPHACTHQPKSYVCSFHLTESHSVTKV